MTSHFAEAEAGDAPHRTVMSGFGVGLSWGVASADLTGIHAPPIVEI